MAFEPPAEAGAQHFGCLDGEDEPVTGHPGAAGIVDATTRVVQLTGNPAPTAWNAVTYAEPIELGGC